MKGAEMFFKTKVVVFLMLITAQFSEAGDNLEKIKFFPINHATFVISIGEKTIYVDPVGGGDNFKDYDAPDMILVTDVHGDHFSKETIRAVKNDSTIIISPQVVYEQLKEGLVMKNGDKREVLNVKIQAIPMYNLTEDRLKYHPKGRGNGYTLVVDGKRIYISGDTEDIEEMRMLEDIDYAFVCMNLPYTMTVEQAASAVLEMKPGVVIPYHYRGMDGFSDLEEFKRLVGENENIEVQLLKWYD
jgi:L-ascorbate metabolism protein UlaG (beta-lactamase superfamily)